MEGIIYNYMVNKNWIRGGGGEGENAILDGFNENIGRT